MTSIDPSICPPLRGRLAPSPTGAQHLGNARTYLWAWLSMRLRGGELVFRIEDLDSPRVKAWAVAQLTEDLAWLGLDWDFHPSAPQGLPPLTQSERLGRYDEVLANLAQGEAIYPCTCTRREIEEAASAPHESFQDAVVYPGTCRQRSAHDGQALLAAGLPFAWRFRMPPGEMHWHDERLGDQSLEPANALGDFVIGRSSGWPAYQLAVVVDDHEMQITEVVRGEDLVPSTYRQIAIYEALGWKPPRWIHLPLVIGSDGRRLAKRHGDTRLSTLREVGVTPETVVGYLAWQSELLDSFRAISPRELLHDWQLAGKPLPMPRESLVFPEADAVDFFLRLQARIHG